MPIVKEKEEVIFWVEYHGGSMLTRVIMPRKRVGEFLALINSTPITSMEQLHSLVRAYGGSIALGTQFT